MEKNWVMVYSSDRQHEIKLAKILLAENDIDSIEINKQDSAYTVLGEIELYVHPEDVIKSKYLIQKSEEGE